MITDGNQRMICRTSYTNNGVFRHNHTSEIRSESNGINGWGRARANLTVGVEANRRSIACSVLDMKDDQENCGFCWHRVVRVNWGGSVEHCDGDLIGTYTKVIGLTTLNRTQEPDFDCCE